MITYRFRADRDKEFVKTLKQRVNGYFKANNLSKKGNVKMVIKSITTLAIFLLPYFYIITVNSPSILTALACFTIMGFGMAFIGTSVMHDAIHGSYSEKKWINNLMGKTTLLIGMDDLVWHIQHNVLHHTYTNVEDADEDIQPRLIMRFSPHQKLHWFHKFQHIYVNFFYGLSIIYWMTVRDFIKLTQYRKKGLIKTKEYQIGILLMVFKKLFFHILFTLIPFMVLDLSNAQITLCLFTMYNVTGIALSLIFQPAHVNHHAEFIKTDEQTIEQNWWVHQLHTTQNFGMHNKALTWFTGGLNYQIEHHLFPNICHIHYPQISKIVQETAHEYQMPYYTSESFGKALLGHYKMLRDLGYNKIETQKPLEKEMA